MANQWLRLWHDMPNDPKWRTIAKASKQPIPSVIAVYVHLLVIASNATERGRTQGMCSEDLASALDLEVEQIESILTAMQGRVLDGDLVSGWSKRQVEREDNSAERAKKWREAQKAKERTQPNATERNRTQDKDTDKDKETTFARFWDAYPKKVSKGQAEKAFAKLSPDEQLTADILAAVERAKTQDSWLRDDGKFIPYPATWLNAKGWLDEPISHSRGIQVDA